MTKARAFFSSIHGKRVAICGIGHNNLPVIHQFLNAGARVLACDKRTEEELGDTAVSLRNAGADLCLGEGYLDNLDVDLILRTPGMKPYLPAFEEAKKRGITVTSEMELFFDLCEAPIYAVTGSDGKTTTTTIIAGLLDAAGVKTFVGGNIGRALLPYVEKIEPHHAAVVELSSFQLTGMKQSPHVAVVNADNLVTHAFTDDCPGRVWQFSRCHPVEQGCWLDNDGRIIVSENGTQTFVMDTQDILIHGVHNIENYMAAIVAVWGITPPEAIRGFARAFGGVEHRCELVRERHGVKWYNDSIGSSPSRTIAGLQAFDKKVILIAGGYDKHIPYAPLGVVAAETVRAAILMGATATAIEESIRACSDMPIIRVENMEQAVEAADKLAEQGDIVFMSPASASFDMYPNFEVRGKHFKDLVQALS